MLGDDMDFSIGELSRRAQVKVPTIRYYEQIGLLAAPPRTEGKQRRYAEADARRLNFIRHARELGFEIEAIRELLDLSTQPDRSCQDADRIARHHLDDVDRRIARLSALRHELTRIIEECGHGRVGECRIIQVIADHDLCETERH
jgi:DNA-binding transcriptional MerR regulator